MDDEEIHAPVPVDPDGEGSLRDMSVLDLKRNARRELHYYFWLRGKTYREITDITGFDRWCIWNDIKYVRANWEVQSRDMDKIRDEALLRLHLDRVLILATIKEAKDVENVHYGNVAKLFAEVADIDKMILQRYTQTDQAAVDPMLEEKMKIIMDYLLEKLGPEGLTDFDEYYKTRLAAKEIGKHTNM